MGDIRATDLASDPRVSEIVIANRTPARADDLARRISGRTVDWEKAAQTPADAYVMALATDAHGDMLDQLLEHGRPILCEKPIALTIADTQRICDAVEQSGAPMQIGFQRRFVRRCECDTDMPHDGPLPQTSHVDAMSRNSLG